MKSKLHLNYSVSSSFAFTEKENSIDCKEDPPKEIQIPRKKRRNSKKKERFPDNIRDKWHF